MTSTSSGPAYGDIRMPGTDGLAATRGVLTDPQLRSVRVIMLTTFDTDEHIFEAIRAGAAGFLLKDTSPHLRQAVRIVAGGDALLSPAVTRRVMAAVTPPPLPGAQLRLAGLTEREREVLAEVAAGSSNDQVAATLFISPATARTYVSRLLTKLQARDRSQLVVIAYETGLVTPGAG